MSLRHNFEAGQTAILLAGAVTVLILGAMGVIPSASAYAIAFLMAVLSLISAKPAWERLNLALRLLALPQAWITHSDFCKKSWAIEARSGLAKASLGVSNNSNGSTT